MAVTALCAQGLDRARLLVAERTARETAERQLGRMTFLSRTTRLMEAPLSVEERLQQLADLAVSEIADWCAVHLVRGDRVDQVAVAHSDPTKVAFVAQLQERYPPDPDAPGGALRVSRTGEPAYYPEIPDELLAAAAVDDEHLALIRSIGMRSAMVVPLAVRGRKLGALTLVQAESERRFDHADLAFARAAGDDRGQSRSTTPASTRSSGAPRTPCRPRCCRPTSPRCPGCASPRATAPPPMPTCSSAVTSTTSCRSRTGAASWWPTSAARAPPRPRSPR